MNFKKKTMEVALVLHQQKGAYKKGIYGLYQYPIDTVQRTIKLQLHQFYYIIFV